MPMTLKWMKYAEASNKCEFLFQRTKALDLDIYNANYEWTETKKNQARLKLSLKKQLS